MPYPNLRLIKVIDTDHILRESFFMLLVYVERR